MTMSHADGGTDDAVPAGGRDIVDLLVVGGGINGVGIARDAAGRGLSVMLVEKGDLAQGTSSRSSRLIHGGLRYLEHGEFRLVREALEERETLLRLAPHLVRPMRFVLPHVPRMRPAWMLRAGLFLYDHLARRARLPASAAVALDAVAEGAAVRPGIRRGFIYSDCRVDDARLVAVTAVSAQRLGARVRTRTELLQAQRDGGLWHARLRDEPGGAVGAVHARALVVAAGPWVDSAGGRIAGTRRARHARLIKGSHIVVPKFWTGDHAYLLQNEDRRVVFALPYEDRFAMIGTTELPFAGVPDEVAISAEETLYLCAAVNRQLRCALGAQDVVHAFAGVRSLADDEHGDPSAVTRDYAFDVDAPARQAPIVTVLGGKITTYRRLAEHALALLRPCFPSMGPDWTGRAALPGGEFGAGGFAVAQEQFLRDADFLPREHARSLFDRHGQMARRILAGVSAAAQMGTHFGAGLYEREVEHLRAAEWARTPEDVLWRRTKFGLRLTAQERKRFEDWMRG
jgi:glycerol-3-phosphate dehydrogenase